MHSFLVLKGKGLPVFLYEAQNNPCDAIMEYYRVSLIYLIYPRFVEVSTIKKYLGETERRKIPRGQYRDFYSLIGLGKALDLY